METTRLERIRYYGITSITLRGFFFPERGISDLEGGIGRPRISLGSIMHRHPRGQPLSPVPGAGRSCSFGLISSSQSIIRYDSIIVCRASNNRRHDQVQNTRMARRYRKALKDVAQDSEDDFGAKLVRDKGALPRDVDGLLKAEPQLLAQALREFIDAWEKQHGALTPAELSRAKRELGIRSRRPKGE